MKKLWCWIGGGVLVPVLAYFVFTSGMRCPDGFLELQAGMRVADATDLGAFREIPSRHRTTSGSRGDFQQMAEQRVGLRRWYAMYDFRKGKVSRVIRFHRDPHDEIVEALWLHFDDDFRSEERAYLAAWEMTSRWG